VDDHEDRAQIRIEPPIVPPVAGRTLSAGLEGERKLVTVLFADLVGSTALASDLDPEEMVEILNGLFSLWVDAVHRYEGTVDKFLGDGMLALFGAPLSHEDDPRRAVLAALEIRDATHSYAETLPGVPLDVRVGLNTGTVVVGSVGSDARMEYTAIGDAVNVAQRIEAAAGPGSILIGEDTFRLVGSYFELDEVGPTEVKGKSESLTLYEVVGDRAVMGTVHGVEGMQSPLVGRDEELNRLLALLEELGEGSGSVIALVGEPGLGKSRLVSEFARSIDGIRWVEGDALSFGANTPYLPVAQLARSLDPDPSDPDLADLVKGTDAGGDDGYRIRLTSAVRSLIISHSPIVVVMEDLHWMDDASLDLLGSIASSTRSFPILLLMTSRPEGLSRVEALHAEVISIDRLDHNHHSELLENLLPKVPDSLRQLVLERSQGNPFFTEEFLRMLIEQGAITETAAGWKSGLIEELTVPPTLNGLIASRIDRLPADSKRVLQAASVLGRVFSEKLLRHVVGEFDLSPLHSGGFLVGGNEPGSHVFKHVITQEVAYSGILKRVRRGLHLRVGEAIEVLYPDERKMRSAELGRHFDLAGDTDRAIYYLKMAAERSFAAFSNEAAISLIGRALELVQDPEIRFELLELRSTVLGHVGRHDEEWATVEQMDAMAAGDDRLRLRMLLASMRCLINTHYLEAYTVGEEALSLSERVGDATLRARVLKIIGQLERRQYSPRRALPYYAEAVELFASESLVEERASALGDLAEMSLMIGDDGAKELIEQALEAARALRNPQLLGTALLRSGLYLLSQAPEKALGSLDQAIEIASDIDDQGMLIGAHRMAGYASVNAGQLARADTEFMTAMQLGRAAGDSHGWLGAAMGLVEVWESQERFSELYQWLQDSESHIAEWGHAHNISYVQYALGYRCLRWLNDPELALMHLVRASEFVEQSPEWRPPAVMFRNGKAAVLIDLGRLDEARTVLDAAKAVCTEHQLQEVTLAYVLVTDARLSMAEGDMSRARLAIEELSGIVSTDVERGEAHAAYVLTAHLAMAEKRFSDALEAGKRARSLEPLRATTRWFSQLAVAVLIADATEALGGDPEPVLAEVRGSAEAFVASLPPEFQPAAKQRSDVARILS